MSAEDPASVKPGVVQRLDEDRSRRLLRLRQLHTWESFNAGPDGYPERTAAGARDPLAPDGNSPAVTLNRIRQSTTDLVNHWYCDEDLAESALRLMIGRSDPLGRPLYRTNWHDGTLEFAFTDEGRGRLTRRLGQDAAHRVEPYGVRLRRSL